MTRENKAGLVVSASFLALVCGVLAIKLGQPPDPADPGGEEESTPTQLKTPPAAIPSATRGASW